MGNGKLRFDEDHDSFRVLAGVFLNSCGSIISTVTANDGQHQRQQIQQTRVDLTEAFVEWRPLPRSSWRLLKLCAGAFYPHIFVWRTTDDGLEHSP